MPAMTDRLSWTTNCYTGRMTITTAEGDVYSLTIHYDGNFRRRGWMINLNGRPIRHASTIRTAETLVNEEVMSA